MTAEKEKAPISTKSAIHKRRTLIEQSVFATFSIHGSWKTLSVLLIGKNNAPEKAFFLSKGVLEENITISSIDQIDQLTNSEPPHVLLVDFDNDNNNYKDFLKSLHDLKDWSTSHPRVFFIESKLLGFQSSEGYGDPDLTIKQLYLDLLKSIEGIFEKSEYVAFHDKLISDHPDEEYENRLNWIFQQKEFDRLKDNEEIKSLVRKAAMRVISQQHASKSFESAFICGRDQELEKLHNLLTPKKDWKAYFSDFPKEEIVDIFKNPVLEKVDQDDIKLPFTYSDIWSDLEKKAGTFLDLRCGKTFNKMSGNEKFQLTGNIKYEEKDVEPEIEQPDVSNSFRKFEVNDNPLSSLMGGSGGGLFPANNPTANMFSKSSESQKKTHSLKEYGDNFLAMLASWHRQCVFVGGALFEYACHDTNDDLVLGSIVVLNESPELLIHTNKMAECLGLPEGKKNDNLGDVLKSFFHFEKNYINFYDKVRSRLKPIGEFYIGKIVEDDYAIEEAESKVKEQDPDRISKRDKEKLAAQKAKNQYLSHLKSVKDAKKSKTATVTENETESAPVVEEEETQSVEVTAPDEEMLENLERKRVELQEQMAEREARQKAQEEARQKRLEEQERRKKELQEQILKRREQEKIEKQKRLEKLNEEKRKREEVRQRRIDSLKNAFVKAQEAAKNKSEAKLANKAAQEQSAKKKKEINPEAVKMMIRFGTDTKSIVQRTGLSEDQVEELRSDVMDEDTRTREDAKKD